MNEREKQNNCSEEHISLLDISDDRVDTEIRHWLPDIYTTTFDWLSDRPTMRINSEYITTIHKSKQKLNSQDRLRFYMGSINIEVAELILSNSQDNRERYYELGDISFFLSLLDFNRQQLEFVTLRPENILSTTTRSQIIGMNPEQSLLFVTEQLLKTSSPYNPVYYA